jgi:hypothetical protein
MKLQKKQAETKISLAVKTRHAAVVLAGDLKELPLCVIPVNSYDFPTKTRIPINAYN